MRHECRTQLERALEWGLDVTHLAPHLSAMSLRPEFFDVYLDLAVDFRLPVRLPSTVGEREAGFPFRALAAEEGVLFPDHFDNAWRAGSGERILREVYAAATRGDGAARPARHRHAGGAGHLGRCRGVRASTTWT